MNQVTATVELDQEKGTVKFSMDLQGDTELDHELLAAAIGSGRSVSISPAHNGNELFAEFTIADKTIWPIAIHNLENRYRVRDGKPTLEQEAEQAAARIKAEADAQKAAEEAAKQPTPEEKMQSAIATGIAQGLKAAGVAPKS